MAGLPIRFTGTALDAAFGRSVVGHRLGDFMHGARGGDVLAGFQRAAGEGIAVWMRQVVRLPNDAPRFVEGIVVPVKPDRLYGALLVGQLADRHTPAGFDSRMIDHLAEAVPA